jgi:hypothetical protein
MIPLDTSAAELRLAVFNSFKNLSGRKVGIVLRGDVPSAALYIASLDAGCVSTAILYRPRGRMVEAYRRSRTIVHRLGPSPSSLLDVEFFSNESPSDAIIHAGWRSRLEGLATTHGVEGHFVTSKEFACYRKPKQLLDAFRVSYFDYKVDASGGKRFAEQARRSGIKDVRSPFLGIAMREICSRYAFDFLNRPRPYELVRVAFPEVDGVGL